MTKSFKMKNLGCANCAAKMEREISKVEGVQSVRVNFMTQKLTLDCQDDSYNDILSKTKSIISRIEPDCALVI